MVNEAGSVDPYKLAGEEVHELTNRLSIRHGVAIRAFLVVCDLNQNRCGYAGTLTDDLAPDVLARVLGAIQGVDRGAKVDKLSPAPMKLQAEADIRYYTGLKASVFTSRLVRLAEFVAEQLEPEPAVDSGMVWQILSTIANEVNMPREAAVLVNEILMLYWHRGSEMTRASLGKNEADIICPILDNALSAIGVAKERLS